MAEQGRRISAAILMDFCRQALLKAGCPQEHAQVVADSLVQANLRGVETHGVIRLPDYLRRIRAGGCDPTTRGEILSETATTMLLDGKGGLGQMLALRAICEAIGKAKEMGVGLAVVRNSNHFGAAAYYAMEALKHDMLGVAMTNGAPGVVPWGGAEPFLSTNPIAVAVPAGRERPFVLDMATSAEARGKVILAAKDGRKIPLGWAVDKDGQPTDDPEAALEGAMLPLGGASGYKGYGLGMVVELLCAVLAAGPLSPAICEVRKDYGRSQGANHFLAAINIAAFIPVAEFKEGVDRLIREIKAVRRAKGVKRILIAGEPEFLREEEQREKGILLGEGSIADLRRVAEEWALPAPL